MPRAEQMVFLMQDGLMGLSPIGSVDDVPKAGLGQISHAVDPVLGGGDFVYLAGCAGTVRGSVVQYIGGTTNLAAAVPNLPGPLAVATAPVGAGQYGWYQRSGLAVVSKTTAAIGAGPVQLAGNGQVAGDAAAGLTIASAYAEAASEGAPTVSVAIAYPTTSSL